MATGKGPGMLRNEALSSLFNKGTERPQSNTFTSPVFCDVFEKATYL